MELWENVKNLNNDAVLPALGEEIKKLWEYELMVEFNRLKRQRTWGPMTMHMIASLARDFSVMPYSKPYASRQYIKKYPETFKKSGELYRKMRSGSPYTPITFGGGERAGLSIQVPLKTENFPSGKQHWVHKVTEESYDTAFVYRWLEEKRSFLKGTFLKIWPKIFDKIRDGIGK